MHIIVLLAYFLIEQKPVCSFRDSTIWVMVVDKQSTDCYSLHSRLFLETSNVKPT